MSGFRIFGDQKVAGSKPARGHVLLQEFAFVLFVSSPQKYICMYSNQATLPPPPFYIYLGRISAHCAPFWVQKKSENWQFRVANPHVSALLIEN